MELQKEYKAWLGFGNAVARLLINPGESSDISQDDRSSIKRRIGDSYNSWADSALWFWNWGMHDDDVHRDIAQHLDGYHQYESDGFSEQLYYYTLKQVPHPAAAPRRILEVGSGAGAGLNFLARFEPQSRFTGVDLAKHVVERANARFSRPGVIEYVNGDAERLPFGDEEFDVVINVESSHNYPKLGAFFSEVQRVLKPGGYFSLVDFFTDERHAEMARCKAETTRMRWIGEQDISEPVRSAIRRRMDPRSTFRRQVKKTASLPARLLLEPNALIQYGSPFAKPNTFLHRLTSGMSDGLRVVNALSSYRHVLASKKR